VLVGLAGFVVAWPLLVADRDPVASAGAVAATTRAVADGWEPYSEQRVVELSNAGRQVFVDFTAAWCITCQVNKRLVLNDARVRDAFRRNGVALVRADWTRRDPAITRALASLGRSGVPVYVLYRKGREPLLFPEVLQRESLISAVAGS
jgi:thiol:disulfide interchange protein DsbD